MKKLFLLTIVLICAAVAAHADDKRVIQRSELPAAAQQFLDEYYPEGEVSMVWKERDFASASYEVRLSDGTTVEFDRSGAWTEVDGSRTAPLPEALVPAEIRAAVERHFSGSRIIKLERDRRGYEAELSNGVDLKFDKQLRLTDIDD